MSLKSKRVVNSIRIFFRLSKVPLLLLLFSMTIYWLLYSYATSIFMYSSSKSMDSEILKLVTDIVLALISSSVFYFFTVTLPSLRKRQIAKKFAIERYFCIKHRMILDLLAFLKKTNVHSYEVKEHIDDYQWLRSLISQKDYYYIYNNYTKQFVKEMRHNLSQIKEVFAYLATYSFVQDNDILYRRIFYLNSWIDDFFHDFELRFIDGNDYDFHKRLEDVISSFLLGFDFNGQKDRDDFLHLLEIA